MSIEAEFQAIEAARSGNLDSFSKLYECYYAAIVWLAYSILGDRNLAEDAAQETFALACEEMVCLKKPEKFAYWLAAICRNVSYGLLRQKNKEASEEVPTEEPLVVLEQSNDDSLAEAVRKAINNLPALYREVLILHYYNDMNYEQMGSVLSACRSTVKGRLFRARRRVKKYLRQKDLNKL